MRHAVPAEEKDGSLLLDIMPGLCESCPEVIGYVRSSVL